MSEAAAAELREHKRLAPTIIRADVEAAGARQEGYLLNVSLGGALLTLEEPLPNAEELTVYVVLPWGLGEFRLDARAVWLQKDEGDRPIGAGVSFLDLSDDAKAKLRSYLERFEELSSEITR